MKDKFVGFLMGVLVAIAALFRSRKFLLALFAVVQTIVFTLRPDINQDIWKAIDVLVGILIASIAHEDAAAKSAGALANGLSAPRTLASSAGMETVDPSAISLAGTVLGLYAAKAFSNPITAGMAYFRLVAAESSVVLGVDAIAQVYAFLGDAPAGGVAIVNQRDDGKGEIFLTDPSGLAEFHFGPGSAFTSPAAPPLHLFAALNPVKDPDSHVVTYDAKLSDEVWVGDTAGLHTHWRIKLRAAGAVLQPPPPVVSDVPVLSGPLDVAVRNLGWVKRAVSWNPDAALYKIARGMALGYPLSDEFQFKDEAGSQYTGQLYAGGIVYVKNGDWQNVKVADWL